MKRAGIAFLLIVACNREGPPPASKSKQVVHVTTTNIPTDERNAREKDLIRKSARFLDSAKLGTKLAADGSVAEEQARVVEGQPVYFTMNLRESPVGLQTHVVWKNAKGVELAKEIHPMNGAKSVTFAMTKPLPPGAYKVEGYWGGNFADEKMFEVEKKKKK